MKKIALQLLSVVIAACVTGCATSLQVIDTPTPPLVLQKSQSARFYITDVVTFPAGTYMPDFKTDSGVYYRAPSKMVHSVAGGTLKTSKRGGIYVPSSMDVDQNLGVWFDHQSAEGGLIGFGLSAPTKVWRLRDHDIQFEPTQDNIKAQQEYTERLKNSLR